MDHRHKVYLSVYLILENENQVLLALRQNTGYADGQWGLVSGHAESQETVREALVREVAEEIGITINPDDLTILHVLHRRSDRENVDFFMKCSAYKGNIINKEPHKCEKLNFFPKDNLPDTIVPYIKEVFEHIKAGKIYSEYGWDHVN